MLVPGSMPCHASVTAMMLLVPGGGGESCEIEPSSAELASLSQPVTKMFLLLNMTEILWLYAANI